METFGPTNAPPTGTPVPPRHSPFVQHARNNPIGESRTPIAGASFPETQRAEGLRLVSGWLVKPLNAAGNRGSDGLEGLKMLISLMLICAVLASLAFGVLAAYGVCLAFFRLMAGRTTAAVNPAPIKAEV